jgi:prephenate dehydrogenase
MRPDTLGVIGLGAIGGSVAWQAVRAGIRRVIGFSPVPSETSAAVRAGAITEAATNAAFVVKESDLVVLATPPAATLGLLGRPVADALPASSLCTDVAAVKTPIAQRARALGLTPRFAGSHPFVTLKGQGFASARPACFRGAVVYVVSENAADRAAREVADFWSTVLGAEPVLTTADHHDQTVGWTTHLPHVASAALAAALALDGPRGASYGERAHDLTGPATENLETWRDLLLLNRVAVLAALDGLECATGRLRAALAAGDHQGVARWLEGAAGWRRRLPP